MNCHISDSEIKDEILFDFPIPVNIVNKRDRNKYKFIAP